MRHRVKGFAGRDDDGIPPTAGPISMLDYPNTRLEHPEDCAVCRAMMPAGSYVATLDKIGNVCTSSCLDRVIPKLVALKWEGKEITEDEAREIIEELQDEAESLRDEAATLDNQASRLEYLLTEAA